MSERPTPWWSVVVGFAVIFAVYHAPDVIAWPWTAYVAMPLVLVASDLVARVQRGRGLVAYGLGLYAGWARNLGIGLAVGIAFAAIAHAIAIALGYERFVGLAAASTWPSLLPQILVMTLIPSLAEDLLTRGYLFRFLAPQMTPASWIVMSAVVFVVNHLVRLGDGLPVLLYLLAIGLTTAWALAVTKSLWATLGLHWGGNLVYLSSLSLVQVEATHPGTATTWILTASYFAMFAWCVFVARRWLRRRA